MARSAQGSRVSVDGSVTDVLRDLIMRRELAPGEQVRQEDLSERLGVSRSPIREALRALESEGLVRHSRNSGYFVAKLTGTELAQIYLMRRVLEAEVFARITAVRTEVVAELRSLNQKIKKAAETNSLGAMLQANREFHFRLFELSDLDLVVRQIKNLWHLSEAYRAAYLWLPETRQRVIDEHDQMIRALDRGDIVLLIEVSNKHRSHSEHTVVQMIGG